MKTPFFCTEGVFRGTRCAKQASTVRKRYSVPKTGFSSTRRILNCIRCKKQASTVRKRYSVPKTAFSGTRRIFKGPQNSRLHRPWTASCRTGRIFRGVPCQKQPPVTPDASSVRETAPALFVRSGGPFPCSFDGTRYQKQPTLGGEQLLTCSNEKWSSATCASTKLRKNQMT